MTDGTVEKIKGKGRNPNSLKNLKPFKPGHPPSGGRPKGSLSFKERAQKFLEIETKYKMPNGTITDQTLLDGAILSLLAQANKGNVPALKELFERVFGKEVEKVELTGSDGQPIAIEHSARLSAVYERAANAFNAGPGLPDAGPPAERLVSDADDRPKS